MKNHLPVRGSIYTVTALIVGLIISISSYSQTFFGVSSNPADNGSLSTNTVTITPPASMQAGDLVVIYAHYRNTGATLTVSTTGGQSWTTENSNSGGTQTTRIFWCEFNGTWGANPVISGGGSSLPLSAIMYVYRPSNSANAWGVHVAQSNSSVTNTAVSITGLTTTVPNTVTMAFWGSPASNTWGTLTGAGWSKTGLSNQYRNTAGSGQSHTAAYNIRATAGAVANVSQTQTSSQSTRTSIICWYEYAPPPANNDCAGNTLLTSDIVCNNISGNMFGATNSGVSVSPCTGPVVYDVWYRFVAATTDPVITLSSLGSAIGTPRMQLFSGTCGSPVSLFCGTTSIAANSLTVGTTYYIRVYASTGTAPTSPTNAGFDICITDTPPTVPVNNNCANAITLPVNGGCSNVNGTVSGSTSSGVAVAPCTGPVGYDVWYNFIAVNTTATITLSSIGANFTNTRLQLFSGSCGSLTSIFCGTTSIAATGLTAGNTYYVRVYSTSSPSPNGNADFRICISTTSPPPRFGNSYVNISKKTNGGVVAPGDTLEIRMTINHTSGTLYRMRYVDNIPSFTSMLTGTTDSIRVITNEGLTYQKFTLAAGDDAATYLASPGPGNYNIRLNLGFGSFQPTIPANNTETEFTSAIGQMTATTDRPRGGGGMIFATSYRVVVTGSVGDTIQLNAGKFIYRTTSGGADIALTATPYKILISVPQSLCANATGINSAEEFGGTFGSGTTLNRTTNLSFPIPGYTFVNSSATQSVGDGQYSIVKNISPRSGTNRNAERTPTCPTSLPSQDACANRMHNGHWDIDGDHTGTNNAIGNLPPAATEPGGYMLMVNADYVASEAFRQTITNLCPNTYYEFSAWIRNICPTCGIDSTGTTYTPRRPGVLPNLTFALDGVDRYSTGEVGITGWEKKGFVFITGPTQTNATFSIRNNSQGGGGNDWVLDDISITTCLPNMQYSPSLTPNICQNNAITIYDTIRSYFGNYVYYKWQRSTNNGASWTDLTGALGPASATWNGSFWEYVTSWVIPPANTTLADSGNLYRVLVATTAANLSNSSCLFTDQVNIITINVLDCSPPLKTSVLTFNGKINEGKANLFWVTSKEDVPLRYIIERSTDLVNFSVAGVVNSYNNSSEKNYYSFVDPVPVNGKTWYRIAMTEDENKKKYTRIIQLNKDVTDFELSSIVNPFKNELFFDITSSHNTKVEIELIDLVGKTVRRVSYQVYAGVNSLQLDNTGTLSNGIYTLRIRNKENYIITRKVIKSH